MSSSLRLRRGFTLVELLVVITIIGILMGLLIPALGPARERGRQVKCTNNLKNLGAAIHAYESSFHVYPVNWGVSDDSGSLNNTIGHSWITQILAQLDNLPLYQRVAWGEKIINTAMTKHNPAYDQNTPVATLSNLNNLQQCNWLVASQYPLEVLTCPSDANAGSSTNEVFLNGTSSLPPSGTPITNYKGCNGNYAYIPNQNQMLKRGNSYFQRWDLCNGIFCRGYSSDPNNAMTLSRAPDDVTDGVSNTIMIGESISDMQMCSGWYWWNGATATANSAINSLITNPPKTPVPNPATSTSQYSSYYGFNSRHPGGAIFCLGDGSTRFITQNIDSTTYQALSTVNGREPIDASKLGL